MPLESGTGIRELSAEECWQRLADHPAKVGRVGTGGPSPDILPVNYAVDGHSIVFRTSPGKKLSAIGRGERVVFEVDDLPLQPWDPAPKNDFVRITTHMVSGREIG
jgi:nitroimidazol reductase NimA-like FMN-containing flavoprotein (pyridoxamine 5'-phosphate oxidase superfamily)